MPLLDTSISSVDSGSIVGALVFAVVWLLVAVAGYVWYAWALSRLFTRLGTDGWRGWVPVLNEMTILERGGLPAWNVVFYFIPVVNLYGLYLKFTAVTRIGQHFGKGTGFAVLGALFTPLWATLLILQRTTGPVAAQPQSPQEAEHRHMAGGLASAAQPAHAAPPAHQSAPPAPAPAMPAPAMPAPTAPAPGVPGPGAVTPGAPPPAAAQPAPAGASHSVPAQEQPEPMAPVDLSPPAPQTPMPEPAPPEAVPTGGVADSGPILVHNPWARPTTPAAPAGQPAAPPSPTSGDVPAWLNDPASASAGRSEPAVLDDDEDDDGATVVVDRRPKVEWHLNVDGSAPLPLVGDKVLLGRRPTATVPGIHPLAVPDTTRTLSKAHARLELVDGEWSIIDLNSTNGVLIVDDAGEEVLITPGDSVPVPGRFILGKVGMHISFDQAGT